MICMRIYMNHRNPSIMAEVKKTIVVDNVISFSIVIEKGRQVSNPVLYSDKITIKSNIDKCSAPSFLPSH